MLKKKRRTKMQPEPVPAPEPIAKIKERRRRRRKPAIKPVIVTAEPKTLMQRIFESQRAHLQKLEEIVRTRINE
jgi:hypothetical protein